MFLVCCSSELLLFKFETHDSIVSFAFNMVLPVLFCLHYIFIYFNLLPLILIFISNLFIIGVFCFLMFVDVACYMYRCALVNWKLTLCSPLRKTIKAYTDHKARLSSVLPINADDADENRISNFLSSTFCWLRGNQYVITWKTTCVRLISCNYGYCLFNCKMNGTDVISLLPTTDTDADWRTNLQE